MLLGADVDAFTCYLLHLTIFATIDVNNCVYLHLHMNNIFICLHSSLKEMHLLRLNNVGYILDYQCVFRHVESYTI